MILERNTFELFGKEVFEHAIIQTPFSKPYPMPDEACFLYVRRGEGIAYSEANQVSAQAKEGILMKCGSYFTRMKAEDQSATYEAIAVHLYPEVLSKLYENNWPKFLTPSKSELPNPPAQKVVPDALFEKFFDSLIFYFSNPHLVNEELMVLKLKELLLLLENTPESDQLHHILSSLFSPQTYSFKSIIEAHIFEPLGIEELATLTGLSLSSFKRTFKGIFNESPAKYVKTRRLKHASSLLSSSDKTISEIAYACAFNDISVFSSSFKKSFGVSPSQYRSTAAD